MSKKWKIAGINFDHMHMGDLLRNAAEHPDVEIVGLSDEKPERMEISVRNFNIPRDRVFTDYRACIEKGKPDLVILCPATAEHGLWTKRVAEYGVHIMVEKPFAASLAEADEMIAAQKATGKLLAINWPIRWYPCYTTTKRLIDEGVIGEVLNVHHYGGNRGPLHHAADKVERTPTAGDKAKSWFYNRAQGGGSLLDYAGYGATLGTWFQGAEAGRGDVRDRSARGARSRGAQRDGVPVRARPFKNRDALGHFYRSVDYAAAAEMRFCHRGDEGDDRRV